MSVERRPLLVRSMTWESDGVLSLDLVDPSGGLLPTWTPGAHIDLRGARTGPHDSAPERQYSLCGDPADRMRYRVAVLREERSRGGSDWVHTVLRPGQLVSVAGPRNNFELIEHPRYLFIAGGIGITPLLPMIKAVDAERADWHLVYGGRRRASMAFAHELAAHGERVTFWPQDERGIIDLDTVLAPRQDTVVYCCGPEPLLAAVERQCTNWPPGRLRVERFAPKPPTELELAARGADTDFEVQLARSGSTVTVAAEQSILAALEAIGVYPDNSCLEGTCGTCETTILQGVPDHRDSILDDEDRAAGSTMMICVSRAHTPRLVLDL